MGNRQSNTKKEDNEEVHPDASAITSYSVEVEYVLPPSQERSPRGSGSSGNGSGISDRSNIMKTTDARLARLAKKHGGGVDGVGRRAVFDSVESMWSKERLLPPDESKQFRICVQERIEDRQVASYRVGGGFRTWPARGGVRGLHLRERPQHGQPLLRFFEAWIGYESVDGGRCALALCCIGTTVANGGSVDRRAYFQPNSYESNDLSIISTCSLIVPYRLTVLLLPRPSFSFSCLCDQCNTLCICVTAGLARVLDTTKSSCIQHCHVIDNLRQALRPENSL